MKVRHARRPRRGWVVAAVIAALVVAGVGVWYARRPTTTAPTQTTWTVATSSEQQTVSGEGTFAPQTMRYATFASSGTVTAVNVTVGQKVTAGQTLASIDPTQLQQQVTVAQANLDAAQSQLATATSAGQSSSQVAAANAQVAADQAKLSVAQQQLDGATLTSPMAGTVAAVSIQTGDRVSGGASSSGSLTTSTSGSGSTGSSSGSGSGGGSGSGSTAQTSSSGSGTPSESIVVVAPGKWLVNTTVDGSSIGQVKPGMQAQITPATGGQLVFGTVSQVGVIGTTSAGAATFPVTVKVTGSPSGLYIGGTGTVSIITRQLDDVLTVPSAALRQNGGQVVVDKVVNGTATSTPVTVGQTFGNQTQILKGLAAGDKVVYTARVRSASGGSSRGTGSQGGFGGLGSGAGRTGSGGALGGITGQGGTNR